MGTKHSCKLIDNAISEKSKNKWQAMLGNLPLLLRTKRKVLRQLLRTGIPQEFRWRVWLCALDLIHCPGLDKDSYIESSCLGSMFHDSCLCMGLPPYSENCHASSFRKQISLDVGRTFPDTLNSEQLEALCRVLNAYVTYNPCVGYCQGMSYVAAVFLFVSGSEEGAFHALIRLLNQHGLSGMYSEGLPLVHWLCRTCDSCLQLAEPSLHSHFVDLGLLPEMYLPNLVMPMFAQSFSFDDTLRLWDVMLCELYHLGPAIFVYIAMSVLQVSAESLKSLDICQIRESMNRIVGAPAIIEHLLGRIPKSKSSILKLGSLSSSIREDKDRIGCEFANTWKEKDSASSSEVEILSSYTAYQDRQMRQP